MRISSETPATRFDTFLDAINNPQLLAMIFEIVRPSPETRRDFQDRSRRQAITNARKNGAEPLRRRSPPWRRPFLSCIFPIVFHRMARVAARTGRIMMSKSKIWLGPESNRRHETHVQQNSFSLVKQSTNSSLTIRIGLSLANQRDMAKCGKCVHWFGLIV